MFAEISTEQLKQDIFAEPEEHFQGVIANCKREIDEVAKNKKGGPVVLRLVCGPSGSGKSQIVQQYKSHPTYYPIIYDDNRCTHAHAGSAVAYCPDRSNEFLNEHAGKVREEQLKMAYAKGVNIIMENTMSDAGTAKRVKEFLEYNEAQGRESKVVVDVICAPDTAYIMNYMVRNIRNHTIIDAAEERGEENIQYAAMATTTVGRGRLEQTRDNFLSTLDKFVGEFRK